MKPGTTSGHLLCFAAAAVIVCCSFTVAIAEAASAPTAHRYEVADDNSTITFFLAGNVHDTLGTVKEMQGSAVLSISPAQKATGLDVRLNFMTDDMNTDDERRDKRMKKKFLETIRYPVITFRSTALAVSAEGPQLPASATPDKPFTCELTGDITIHGVSRKITLPLTIYPKGKRLVTRGGIMLQLPDFSIKNPSLLIFRTANEVKIDFHIELIPKA